MFLQAQIFKKVFRSDKRERRNSICSPLSKKSNLPLIEKQRALPIKGKVYFVQRLRVCDVRQHMGEA